MITNHMKKERESTSSLSSFLIGLFRPLEPLCWSLHLNCGRPTFHRLLGIKVKLFLSLLIKHYAMKMYGGVDVQIQVFLTSALVVVSFMPRPLYPRGKSPRYPLDRRLGQP
jgi:hypothetical protein